ncbi:MAG: hypothetical protein LUF85_09805 [Bacteroides sp.]|nr:hypothetical protein [Bacteroides sp.]
MKRGYIKIEETANGHYRVKAELYKGTVWLTQYEIADLFGVFESTISSKLKTLFKNGLLREEEVKRNVEVIRSTAKSSSKGQTYIDLYNMEVILMLSYHLNSMKITIFRKWVQTVLNEHIESKEPLQVLDSMFFYNTKVIH